MAQLSPGVLVNEVVLSVIVPQVGNITAAYAGVFVKGPSDTYTVISNVADLIDKYGEPTNDNYNDWYQCWNFLQYSGSLLVSRAVDKNGTFNKIANTVSAVNELGKVEVANVPTELQAGDYIKFSIDENTEYKIINIETDVVEAVKQEQTITVNSASDGDYTINMIDTEGNITPITYSADVTNNGDDVNTIATNLGALLENYDTSATNISVTDNIITVTSTIAGVDTNMEVAQGDMTIVETVAGVAADSYELVFDSEIDFGSLNIVGSEIYKKTSALNSIAIAPIEGVSAKTAAELKLETIFIPNEEDYETREASFALDSIDKIKFIAKSSGVEMNGVEIAIAREADFESGTANAFNGIGLNSLFETKPSEANKEIAIVIKKDTMIVSTYIVSLLPGAKDYRNKSIYIEDVINRYDPLVYAKCNDSIVQMPDSRLYEETVNKVLILSNGDDGVISDADISEAYGNVESNEIFGNKEGVDIDIIIANEKARTTAGYLATNRADCICFHGARFEDTVGIKSSKIVENLIAEVVQGEMKSTSISNSFNAYFGNYKYQYDKYNDKMRWVSIVGDVAGLRAKTNAKLDSWWASAGLDRGQILNTVKLAFIPNQGQRDLLYKNRINPIASFPGQGEAIVWGQKTMTPVAGAFDRINVRGLFNTLERSISRMAKAFLFEFNDAFSRNRFVATITPFLNEVKAGRGITDFYVQCNELNNTPEVIDDNRFVATIAVKPTRIAEFIKLDFVAVASGVEFKEIFN